jgi:hypothetical protein
MTREQVDEAHALARRLQIKLRSQWAVVEKNVLKDICAHMDVIVAALVTARESDNERP